MYNKDWLFGTNVLHHECKLLKVKDLHELRVLTFVRKCLNKETISLFHNYYSYKRDHHTHNTRNILDLSIPRSLTNSGLTRIKSIGAKYWNNYKEAQKNLDVTIDTFKHNLKNNIIRTYSD